MNNKKYIMTGNMAAAYIAYAFSEIAIIYPITPSSDMGELIDIWSNIGKKNLFDNKLKVIEMQSESGVAGALHGVLTAGSIGTTFTASQGLLLMIPNMYKIVGEMLPIVFHVSARAIAYQSLSIFGDHSDVMSCRNIGLSIIASSSVQEVIDFSTISHLSTFEAKIPFISFFDGFRTSHETQNIEIISYKKLSEMLEYKYINDFRQKAIKPEIPFAKPGAQNPDIYFQGRESINTFYNNIPMIVKKYMKKIYLYTGRKYDLFDYVGDPNADKIIVSMGSSCDTIEETIKYLNKFENQKTGLIKVRLYRPFHIKTFIKKIPLSVKKIAVLDRIKEPGSIGEPLYIDIISALKFSNKNDISVIGGRYGLSSKEFTPTMVKAIFLHLDNKSYNNFTIGINDDVTNRSINIDKIKEIYIDNDITKCIFWGLGSDGTVGANKITVKIINDNINKINIQGYGVYDSKKSYGVTISHLRFGKSKIKSPYLISNPNFVACHHYTYLKKYNLLFNIVQNGIFLLNSNINEKDIFKQLPIKIQKKIIENNIKFYIIDAFKISYRFGLDEKIGTIMQTAFFKIMDIFSENKFKEIINNIIKEEYSKKGNEIVNNNLQCIEEAWCQVKKISTSKKYIQVNNNIENLNIINPFKHYYNLSKNKSFIDNIFYPISILEGDKIPVSKVSADGIIPTSTTKLEKRSLSKYVPHWIPENCTQCNQCVSACPHSAIRAKQIDKNELKNAPKSFKTLLSTTKNNNDLRYKIQIYIDDCTGCKLCINSCPFEKKGLSLEKIEQEKKNGEVENYIYFDSLKENLNGIDNSTLKGIMFKQPLFEFPGACKGCGETPYIKILTQLYGNRMIIANATGCSSIYGGTYPNIPYCTNELGHGPAWANSLFEDNAEYGLGIRLAINSHREQLKIYTNYLIKKFKNNNKINNIDKKLIEALKKCIELWNDKTNNAINAQHTLKNIIKNNYDYDNIKTKLTENILLKIIEFQNYFVEKSVWSIGGDGWAYDIGYNGLDHCISTNNNIKILVLDTEVYSNTGGQSSKATQLGAIAKFSSDGKNTPKKNLAIMCMNYENVYVASIAFGANKNQTLMAFKEAEEHNGPSVIIAYSPCIAHGIDMSKSQEEQKKAVNSGYWPLFRYNPNSKTPFSWDSKEPIIDYIEFIKGELRYSTLYKKSPENAKNLFELAKNNSIKQVKLLQHIGKFFNKLNNNNK